MEMFTFSISQQKLEILEWLCLVSSMCMTTTLAGIFSPAESSFSLTQPEDSSILMSLGGSRCVISCSALDALGPPPDAILTIPPPPIPNFILDTLNLNRSDDGNCNFCHIFGSDEKYSISTSSVSTWILALICAVVVAAAGITILIISFLKCKKWKVFPVADSCPILPENFLTNKHSTSSKSCKDLAPSKISKQKTKEEKSKNKYWKEEYSQEHPSHAESSQYIIGNETDEQSSPGTPIYAELDVTPGKGYESEKVHNSDCSPYAVHTYVGLDKDTQVGHTRTLMNDGAYDNAAFMPSEGKKSPQINHACFPKISQQSPGTNIPQWSNSVPASPMPSYPQKSPSIHKTYSLGRKAIKSNSALPTLARVKIPKINIPHPESNLTQFQNATILPTTLSKSDGSVVEVVQKRPLPPIPLEHVNNVNF